MKVLGIEGTAHTVSCGIIDPHRIYSNVSHTLESESGGIHPRDAAIHHSEYVLPVITEALGKSGLSLKDIDLVAFSRGPGLGPCLRVVATAARALSQKAEIPILGVNHPLGHVEIGRRLTGARNPIMLYVSGGNTQVIAHIQGRYRVLGETMDIGLGNLLDKLGRDIGLPFPGGPGIERYANLGTNLLDLPYSVKGMDTSFSGIYTAARRLLVQGSAIEDVCFSVQEHTFAMLIEVLERAMHQTGKKEVLLAGGVARNRRLKLMLEKFSLEAGVKFYPTDPEYCMDNGAMIAQAGLLMYGNGARQQIEETTVDQRFRIDQVPVPWIEDEAPVPDSFSGAESTIKRTTFHGREVVVKERLKKRYRNRILDSRLRQIRARNEILVMQKISESGCLTPVVYDFEADIPSTTFGLIPGRTLSEFLSSEPFENSSKVLRRIGSEVASFHSRGVSHGDLTPSNIVIGVGDTPYFIDTSLGKADCTSNDAATDIFLFNGSLASLNNDTGDMFRSFMEGYAEKSKDLKLVNEELLKIERRRRYV